MLSSYAWLVVLFWLQMWNFSTFTGFSGRPDPREQNRDLEAFVAGREDKPAFGSLGNVPREEGVREKEDNPGAKKTGAAVLSQAERQ